MISFRLKIRCPAHIIFNIQYCWENMKDDGTAPPDTDQERCLHGDREKCMPKSLIQIKIKIESGDARG